MTANEQARYNPWLHWFAVLAAFFTFLLLGLGGLVTSHGAGMSVPDWPNSYGYNMFFFPVSHWVGGILYEHSHRLLALVVGALWCVVAFGRSREALEMKPATISGPYGTAPAMAASK